MSASAGPAGREAGRTCVIVNPAAGHVRAQALFRRIESAFAALGEPIDLVATTGPGHATALARAAAAAGYRAVCAVGGDGTLAETATALIGTGIPLAVVPRGTANQVAANLGIPMGLQAAIRVAVTGRPVDMDAGSIGGRVFVLAAGAGFDAAVMKRATRALKERWGFGAYVYAALKVSVAAPRTLYRIVADGEELHVAAMSVLVANVGALYATFPPARMVISPEPESAWCDGLFDVVVLQPTSVPGFAGLLARLAIRGFGGQGLLHLRAREVRIEGDPVVPFQVDGDFAGHTPFDATVLPGALRVLTPFPFP
jgi:YegS/Rv2252/BmrU family lipid kinase